MKKKSEKAESFVYNAKSICMFMSATKSILSLLALIAIDEGKIKGLEQPITDYIPELEKGGSERFTIQNLLDIDSGIPFKESLVPWSSQMKQYFMIKTKKNTLKPKINYDINASFNYKDWYSELLILILEKATGTPVKLYLEEKMWKFIDFTKTENLFVDKGSIKVKQIISRKYLNNSKSSNEGNRFEEYFQRYKKHPGGKWFYVGNTYYDICWGYKSSDSRCDFFAMGSLEQILYVCPHNSTIFVKLGETWGISDWWPSFIKSNN